MSDSAKNQDALHFSVKPRRTRQLREPQAWLECSLRVKLGNPAPGCLSRSSRSTRSYLVSPRVGSRSISRSVDLAQDASITAWYRGGDEFNNKIDDGWSVTMNTFVGFLDSKLGIVVT